MMIDFIGDDIDDIDDTYRLYRLLKNKFVI